ncbi:MAG TPA: Rho-binding antiterminator [Thermoanaerobaculia bacterium]|nr:Rho-binding antiterminator [Thermoanaerobaculia bacterium]
MSEKAYESVSCDCHDVLEAAAVQKREVELEFHSRGVQQRERGQIEDVFAREGEEFVRLRGGAGSVEIRLDQIVALREI